jgi:hypothetical protein
MPEAPFTSEFHVLSMLFPSGVSAPSPVMTMRAFMARSIRLLTEFVKKGEKCAQGIGLTMPYFVVYFSRNQNAEKKGV